ncbi:MAG: tetrahydrofolate dehydrogenase/cyclohydrolase catalytic domain-containing protein, partial [Cetobacterium sp.]
TNPDDEPSERYIRNKRKKMLDNGIESILVECKDDMSLRREIIKQNNTFYVTSIILQLPLGKGVLGDKQTYLDLVDEKKDIDRLHSKWFYNVDYNNLPLTAKGIYEILNELKTEGKNLLFIGNGPTVNQRLFLKMFSEGKYDCRITNSKTPEKSTKELIEWSDVIIASTGIAEWIDCKGKYIISPTINKGENGDIRSELKSDLRDSNNVHKIIGGIGKLTTSALLKRAYEDAKHFLK